MNAIFKTCLLLLVAGILFTSCNKDGEDTTDNNNTQQFDAGNGQLSCKVDGSTFEASLEYCTLADGTLNLGNFLENDAQLQFTPAQEGTFSMNIGGQGTQDILFLVLGNGTNLTATSGTITITELGDNAKGTFSAECIDYATNTTYSITEGSFSANLF